MNDKRTSNKEHEEEELSFGFLLILMAVIFFSIGTFTMIDWSTKDRIIACGLGVGLFVLLLASKKLYKNESGNKHLIEVTDAIRFTALSITAALFFLSLLPSNLFIGRSKEQTDDSNRVYSDVWLGDYSITSELRVGSMKEVYGKDGDSELKVEFIMDDLNDKIECSIPKELADTIDKNAVYMADIKIGYISNILEDYISSGGGDIKDLLIKKKDWYTFTEIDFMFSDYISSEFKTIEELKSDFQSKE